MSLKKSSRALHRKWSLLLLPFLCIWLLTALGMALVPRSATTAYRATVPTLDALALWPEVDTLHATALGESSKNGSAGRADRVSEADSKASETSASLLTAAVEVSIEQQGPLAVLSLRTDPWSDDSEHLDPGSLTLMRSEQPSHWRAWAESISGESMTDQDFSLVVKHSPAYQKLPLPAVRVEAKKATLFLDPITGQLRHQATQPTCLKIC